MNFQKLNNNCILIVPNNLKEKILIKTNDYPKLFDFKMMNLEDFKTKYYFNYTTESICFIMKNYKLDYEFCLEIINYLYSIDECKVYREEKLNFLKKIKLELIDNKLLITDDIFKNYIKNKNIYIYGYDYIDSFSKEMLHNLNVQTIVDEKQNYIHDVYEFETIDDEVKFVANKICELIIDKVPLEKIKIIAPSNEYITVIKRIFKIFNLPINLNNNYLISTKIVSNFFKYLDVDITTTLEKLKELLNKNDELSQIEYNQIVNICNKYNWCNNFIEIKDALVYEFKHTKIEIPKLKNSIEIVSLEDNSFENDEFVFLIGFNQGSYPKTYKDDDYLTDTLKLLIKLETTTQKNIASYNSLISKLKNIKNIYISYKLKTPFNSYYKSQIIDDLNLNIVNSSYNKEHYSKLNDQLNLTAQLDNYLKYGEKSNDLELLFSNYQNINYRIYDNQYTKINESCFRKYLKNNLLLSYSSINNFYRCGFRYYIENILKLQITNNDFTLFIGNLFHYVLSKMYNENFNFEACFQNYINNNYEIKSYKEKFFIQKLKKELNFIIATIKEQDNYTTFDQYLFEEVVNIDLSKDNYKITFKGIIDKIMYKKTKDETLISIIDYKTGNPNLNLNNLIYGLDMQLCIYAYLSSKMEVFANPKLVGIYLQKVLNSEINIEKNKDYFAIKKENLKLQGYSTNNETILKQFDKTYEDSNLIKSLKIGNNGFYAYSKIFDQAMLNSLLQIVDDNIKTARNKILDREFYINPKKIGIKNLIGCEHCQYKEICFMTEDDIVHLQEYKKLEFLKGDAYEMD